MVGDALLTTTANGILSLTSTKANLTTMMTTPMTTTMTTTTTMMMTTAMTTTMCYLQTVTDKFLKKPWHSINICTCIYIYIYTFYIATGEHNKALYGSR